MADTVRITKFRSGFRNVPARFVFGDHDDGTSYLVSSNDYYVPAGFFLGVDMDGTPVICDARGYECEIVEHSSGRPQIIGGDPHSLPALKPVKED